MSNSSTKLPISVHPFFVIYERKGTATRSNFDSTEEAQSFIDTHKDAPGYYMLGLYQFNTRKLLPDSLDDDGVRRDLLREYIKAQFPEETPWMKQQREAREATRLVVLSYLGKFGLILLAIGLAAGCNYWFGQLNAVLGSCLALLFFGGGTLGYLIDWKIKTFGGHTFAERLSEWVLIVCYVLGTFVTVLSIDLGTLFKNSHF